MVLVGLGRVLGGTMGGALGVCDGSGVSRVGPLEAFAALWGPLERSWGGLVGPQRALVISDGARVTSCRGPWAPPKL